MEPNFLQAYRLIVLLRLTWDKVYRYWVDETRDTHLTPPEEEVLTIIAATEPVITTELADYLFRDKGTVSKNVKSLERRGFVLRESQDDRRFHTLSLSQKGEEYLKEMQSRYVRAWAESGALEGFTKEEFEVLCKKLEVLVAGLYGTERIPILAKKEEGLRRRFGVADPTET